MAVSRPSMRRPHSIDYSDHYARSDPKVYRAKGQQPAMCAWLGFQDQSAYSPLNIRLQP